MVNEQKKYLAISRKMFWKYLVYARMRRAASYAVRTIKQNKKMNGSWVAREAKVIFFLAVGNRKLLSKMAK